MTGDQRVETLESTVVCIEKKRFKEIIKACLITVLTTMVIVQNIKGPFKINVDSEGEGRSTPKRQTELS